MNEANGIEALYPRPVMGDTITRIPPAQVPTHAAIAGRYVELVPMHAAKHCADLYVASHGIEAALHIWDYLADGPWPNVHAYQQALRQQTASLERLYYTICPATEGDAPQAVCGQASFMDVDARNGVIEIGHIWFGPNLQRTRAATEALYLMIGHAMDDLGYRRIQWRCNAQNLKSRAAAKRIGFHCRTGFSLII